MGLLVGRPGTCWQKWEAGRVLLFVPFFFFSVNATKLYKRNSLIITAMHIHIGSLKHNLIMNMFILIS